MASLLGTDVANYLSTLNTASLVLLMLLVRLIWKRNAPAPQTRLLYNPSSKLLQTIVSKCKCLNEEYVPTFLWGKNGHVQSILHTTIGRFGGVPNNIGTRHKLTAADGAIISYDIFEPDHNAPDASKYQNELILVVPGICNHAENTYIKAFTAYMCQQGFRIAVFNHTGALKSVELKRPRIFTYGHTSDLDQVTQQILRTEKPNKLIGLAFSLGGNILLKYLGEKPERQKNFHFAVSVCAGYDVPECNELFQQWTNLRKFYNYGLTRNVLKIVKHHQPTLAKFCQSMEPPLNLNWDKIISTKALHELDEEFTLKLHNETDINRFYQENSSSPYLDKIRIPLLLLNAEDDPLIPEEHYKHSKRVVEANENALFVVSPFGGHLGFFEGGILFANQATWLDRTLSEFFKVTLDVVEE